MRSRLEHIRVMRAGAETERPAPANTVRARTTRAATACSTERLALGELEASACALLAVLLALLTTRIAGNEAFRLERLAELGVEFHEGAGDAELDGVRLTHNAAATNRGDDVKGLADVVDAERALRCCALLSRHEVNINVLLVDCKVAAAGTQKNARDRRLAAAGAIVLDEICHDAP